MNGCNSCKHNLFNIKTNSRYCNIGNNDKQKIWWENNGKKYSTDKIDSMVCCELSKVSIVFNDLEKQTNDLLTSIRNL